MGDGEQALLDQGTRSIVRQRAWAGGGKQKGKVESDKGKFFLGGGAMTRVGK